MTVAEWEAVLQRPYEERVLDLQRQGWRLLVAQRSVSSRRSRTVSALNKHVARRLVLEAKHDKFAAEARSESASEFRRRFIEAEVLRDLNQERRRIIQAQGHCWRFISQYCPLLPPPGWLWGES
jgi:hypothetical protein